MKEYNVICGDDFAIGFVKDLNEMALDHLTDEDFEDEALEMLNALIDYEDGELVRLDYHPMGAYIVSHLVKENL